MTKIQVFVRERPTDQANAQQFGIEQIRNGVLVTQREEARGGLVEKSYELDNFWPGHTSQIDVFTQVGRPSCDKALDGYNSTVIAYGATSTGKTYTTFGDSVNPGLVPNILDYLFQQKQFRVSQCEYQFFVSFLELYLDQVYDLLIEQGKETDQKEVLKLRQSPAGSFYAEGLSVIPITNTKDAMKLLMLGEQQRKTFSTSQNERSSRSHAIFSIGVIQTSRRTGQGMISLLSFVDLAGSENINKSESIGLRKMEAASINRSLSTLGFVIQSLAVGAGHIPYRESKLTRLLQDALGGSSYTAMICTIYPSLENKGETNSTMSFGNRCRNVVNMPKVSLVDPNDCSSEQKLKQLKDELQAAKQEMASLKLQNDELLSDNYSMKEILDRIQDSTDEQAVDLKDDSIQSQGKKAARQLNQSQLNQSQSAVSGVSSKNNGLQQQGKIPLKAGQKVLTEADAQKLGKTQLETANVMRHKIEDKNREIFQLQQSLREEQAQSRKIIFDLKDQVSQLQHLCLEQNAQQRREIGKLQDLQREQFDEIADANVSLSEKQNNFMKTLEKFNALQSGSKLKDYSYEDLLQQFDVQKMKEVTTAKLQGQLESQRIQNSFDEFKRQIEDKQRSDGVKQEKVKELVQWLYVEWKKLYQVVTDAKEGKVDAIILNETDVIKSLMEQQFISIPVAQRRRIRTAIVLEDWQYPMQMSTEFVDLVNDLKPTIPKNQNVFMESTIKHRPVSARVEQKKIVAFFGAPKPPNVMLDTDIHISPRPQASARPNSSLSARNLTSNNSKAPTRPQSALDNTIYNSTLIKRPSSAIGMTSSQVGSLGGTTELRNKQYQQWGW